jgi:membrane-associated protease RseP (regulator of RpoE activity)
MTMKANSTTLFRPLMLGLALAIAAATAGADPGHGYPGNPNCQMQRGQGMPGGGDCPMARQGMPMMGKSLGVLISNLPDSRLDQSGPGYGVSVEKVLPDSAAASAGIRTGDVIIEFSGKPVFSGERLRWLVRQAESDKQIEVKLIRDGKAITLNATLPVPKAPPCMDKKPAGIGT